MRASGHASTAAKAGDPLPRLSRLPPALAAAAGGRFSQVASRVWALLATPLLSAWLARGKLFTPVASGRSKKATEPSPTHVVAGAPTGHLAPRWMLMFLPPAQPLRPELAARAPLCNNLLARCPSAGLKTAASLQPSVVAH